MISRKLALGSLSALAAGAMLALSMSPASAFPLAAPSVEKAIAANQIENADWHHHWRHHHWRHHHRHCWRGTYGRLHCR